MEMNFKDVKKVFYRDKEIKAIYKGDDVLWQSFKKVTYPCDLRGIDLDVLDKDSPKFNRDLAYAAWFLHRGVFYALGYQIPPDERQKQNAKVMWSSEASGIDSARSANLLHEAHTMMPSPSNGNTHRAAGYWNKANLAKGENVTSRASFDAFNTDKPHKLLVRYYTWESSPTTTTNNLVGLCCNTNLDLERKYSLSFWYRLRTITDESLDDIIVIYPGFNETLPGFSIDIKSSGYQELMPDDSPIKIKKSELIMDNKWHRHKVFFNTKELKPGSSLSPGGLRTMLGFFHSEKVDISLAGFCLKYLEKDNDVFTTGFTFDTPRNNITRETEALFNALCDAPFFNTHGYKLFHLCEYIPNINRTTINTDDTDLHLAVEKRVQKLDDELDELANWYRNVLPTLNIQTGYIPWADIDKTGESVFTWNFKYKEQLKARKGLGLVTRYDRKGFSPNKYVKNVILDVKFYSVKQASDDLADHGPYDEYLSTLSNIIDRGYSNNTGVVLHVKYENLTPKEWVEDEVLRNKYLYEYAPGKYGLRFDVEEVVTAYSKWIQNTTMSLAYNESIIYIILGVIGENGKWTFGEGYRPVDAATLKKILLPWFNTWGMAPKIVLPKYMIEADNLGVSSFINSDIDDINKSNTWFNTLKNGGADSDIQNLNLVVAKNKLQDIKLIGLGSNHDSLTDLTDSQIDQTINIIREQGLNLYGPINEKDLLINKKKVEKLTKAIPRYRIHLAQIILVLNGDDCHWTIVLENRGEIATRITRVYITTGMLVNGNYSNSTPTYLQGDDIYIKPGVQKIINITTKKSATIPNSHDQTLKINIEFEGSDIGEYYGEGMSMSIETIQKQDFKKDFDTEELDCISIKAPEYSLHLHNTEEQRRKRR